MMRKRSIDTMYLYKIIDCDVYLIMIWLRMIINYD